MSNNPDIGLPKAVVGWIYNHARKNYWRVAAWYEVDDLIQDGLMIAYKCRERYGLEIDPPHFMQLVKVSFHNHIGDLLRRMRAVDDGIKFGDLVRNRNRSGDDPESEQDVCDRLIEPQQPDIDYKLLISEMPEYLRKVIDCYLSSPEKLRRSLRVRLNGPDETWQERLAKLTGFPIEKDFETELRAYLWERELDLV